MTPLQMARAYAGLANGGAVPDITPVSYIENSNGECVKAYRPNNSKMCGKRGSEAEEHSGRRRELGQPFERGASKRRDLGFGLQPRTSDDRLPERPARLRTSATRGSPATRPNSRLWCGRAIRFRKAASFPRCATAPTRISAVRSMDTRSPAADAPVSPAPMWGAYMAQAMEIGGYPVESFDGRDRVRHGDQHSSATSREAREGTRQGRQGRGKPDEDEEEPDPEPTDQPPTHLPSPRPLLPENGGGGAAATAARSSPGERAVDAQRSGRRSPGRSVFPRWSLVLAVSVLFLGAGYALKAQCLAGFGGREYSHLCYNDIQPLYGIRGVAEHIFPYVDGQLAGLGVAERRHRVPSPDRRVHVGVRPAGHHQLLVPQPLGPPAGALRVADLLAAVAHGRPASAAVGGSSGDRPLCLPQLGPARGRGRHRGVLSVVDGPPGWAAVAFGIGGALKMYPLYVPRPPRARARLAQRSARGASRVALVGAGTWLAVNLPFMFANFDGWYATYAFHRQRTANFDSIWQFGWPEWSSGRTNLVSTGLLVLVVRR